MNKQEAEAKYAAGFTIFIRALEQQIAHRSSRKSSLADDARENIQLLISKTSPRMLSQALIHLQKRKSEPFVRDAMTLIEKQIQLKNNALLSQAEVKLVASKKQVEAKIAPVSQAAKEPYENSAQYLQDLLNDLKGPLKDMSSNTDEVDNLLNKQRSPVPSAERRLSSVATTCVSVSTALEHLPKDKSTISLNKIAHNIKNKIREGQDKRFAQSILNQTIDLSKAQPGSTRYNNMSDQLTDKIKNNKNNKQLQVARNLLEESSNASFRTPKMTDKEYGDFKVKAKEMVGLINAQIADNRQNRENNQTLSSNLSTQSSPQKGWVQKGNISLQESKKASTMKPTGIHVKKP